MRINSGPRIQFYARVITIFGIICSIVLGVGIVCIAEYMWMLFLGIAVIPVGTAVAVFTGICIHGFGEMVDNIHHLRFSDGAGADKKLGNTSPGDMVCAVCGANVLPEDTFCDNCGTRLKA